MPRNRLVPLRGRRPRRLRQLASGSGLSLRKLLGNGAKSDADFLPADQAFVFSATSPARDRVQLRWDIADEYYLYRDKVKVTTSAPGVQLGTPAIRGGETKHDEYFGEQVVFYGEMRADLSIVAAAGVTDVPLEVTYQGCADAGLCYPPLKKSIVVKLGATPLASQACVSRASTASTGGVDAVRAGPARRQDPQRQPAGGAGDVFWRRPAARADAVRAADGADPVRHHRRRRWRHARVARARILAVGRLRARHGAYVYGGGRSIRRGGPAGPGRVPETVDHRAVRGLFVWLALGMFGLFNIQVPGVAAGAPREPQQQAAARHA